MSMDMTPNETIAWETLRVRPSFRNSDIRAAASVSQPTAGEWVAGWVRRGIVKVTGRDALGTIYAPILETEIDPAPLGGTSHGNMWRAARMLGEFSARDIAAHSCTELVAVSEADAGAYCSALLAAGYLRVTQKAIPERRVARYRLIRNTGALPPRVRRVKALVDPNLKDAIMIGRIE